MLSALAVRTRRNRLLARGAVRVRSQRHSMALAQLPAGALGPRRRAGGRRVQRLAWLGLLVCSLLCRLFRGRTCPASVVGTSADPKPLLFFSIQQINVIDNANDS